MQKYIDKIRREIARQTLCVNITLVIISACICAAIGIIFVICGMDYEMYSEIAQPAFYFPCIIMAVLQIFFYAVIGAGIGIIISTPYYRRNYAKLISISLALGTLFLCFAWVSLVYTAASFFLAFIVCLIILVLSATTFKFYITINTVAAWVMFVFMLFDFYLACYSISLFIIN